MSFSQDVIERVWQKGRVVPEIDGKVFPGLDPARWRKDDCGAWMGRIFYGDRSSEYGWVIDHIVPVSQGGSDEISNLRPFQHQNAAARAEDASRCAVTSDGVHNVVSG